TNTRRTSETNSTPRTDPTSISAVDFQYASLKPNDGQEREIRKAGRVKMAPAATDSPMDPAVRAMFASGMVRRRTRRMAIEMTAAGYVAAIVTPARSPRYALAAPRTTVMTRPMSMARAVNSFMLACSGTKGWYLVLGCVAISVVCFNSLGSVSLVV